MSETNKFKDDCGDWIQAFINDDGLISVRLFYTLIVGSGKFTARCANKAPN